jgi:hypothetical protein
VRRREDRKCENKPIWPVEAEAISDREIAKTNPLNGPSRALFEMLKSQNKPIKLSKSKAFSIQRGELLSIDS